MALETVARVGRIEIDPAPEYSLVGFGHGHTWALVRGFPPLVPEPPERSPVPVVDLCFTNVRRVSCWSDLGPVDFRRAAPDERAGLERRIGTLPQDATVFLLERDSTESYVIADRLYWAGFLLPSSTAPSPLGGRQLGEPVEADPTYAEAHPPVDGIIRFVDHQTWAYPLPGS